MEMLLTTLGVVALIFVVLSLGTWVFAGLVTVSILSLFLLGDFELQRIGVTLTRIIFRAGNAWELSAIPLFILMGELIFRSDISERLFRGLEPLASRIPGGILHTNIFGCTLFAAVSGSSSATTATVGKITTRELQQRGYDRRLSIGSLAGAGSLGLLIPPSIVMIVYGVQAEVSISKLFMAGVLPGLLIACLYSGYLCTQALLHPEKVPREQGSSIGWLQSLRLLSPVLGLILVVIGSIYTGLATPSEAAAVGVGAALLLLLVERQLNWQLFTEALSATVISSVMVCSILVCAALLSTTVGYLHIPQELARLHRHPGVVGTGAAADSGAVLHCAGAVSGWHLHHRHEPADHPAAGDPGRLRSALVRGFSGDHGGTGADHPAGGVQPLCPPGADRGETGCGSPGRRAVLPVDVRGRPDHLLLPPDRALAAATGQLSGQGQALTAAVRRPG